MGDTSPPLPPWSLSEVLGTGRLPDNFVGDLSAQFLVTNAKVEALSKEFSSCRRLHVLLRILSAKVAPSPVLEHFNLLAVDRDSDMHILYPLFSVPVGRTT